jgi:hypothetical protein
VTFSTTNPPRLGQTPTALTSLGAVGGPRGAGAGALRIFVEFLSTYDRQATQALETDLARLAQANQVSLAAEVKRNERLLQVRGKLAEAEKIRVGVLDTSQRAELKQIEALAASRNNLHRKEAAARKDAFLALDFEGKLSKEEIGLLFQRAALKKEEAKLVARNVSGNATQARIAKQILEVEQQIERVQRSRAAIGPRLQGLALGLVGGALGAAVIGGAFTAISAGVDAVIEKIQDIIDPARHARKALEDVGKAINDIAKSEGISVLEATSKFLADIGITADRTTQALLSKAAVDQRAMEILKAQNDAYEIAIQNQALEQQLRELAIESINREAVARGLLSQFQAENLDLNDLNFTIDGLTKEEAVLRRLAEAQALAASEGFRLQAAQEAMALSAARATLANELLAGALARATSASVAPLQTRLENLSPTASPRTRRLERAVASGGGGGGSGVGQQLQNIAEERALILLRQRLRLLGTAINLERYSGKFLLEAINAKIAALQKQNREQDRLNQLLDLQYRMSQTIRRQQGESIGDFLARRAQENRSLLAEQDDLERQRRIDRLEDLKSKVQDEVALAELAEQRKNALAAAGASSRQKSLQKELEASRKHDREVYEAKKKALEAQIKAEQEKNKDIQEILKDSVINETRILIRGAGSLQDLAALQGRIQGYKQAKATIQGLVQAFGLPAFIAGPFLDKIDALLNAFYSRRANLLSSIPGRVGGVPLQHGGVFTLNNASSMFGGNVQLGEAGTELGIVLSHKVADILQKQRGSTGQIGPFILQNSQDPLADRYRFGRLVKESVEEALA